MKKKTKKMLIVIFVIILTGFTMMLGHCQSFEQKDRYTRLCMRDTILNRMTRVIKRARSDSDEIKKVISFVARDGVLATPTLGGFRFLSLKPEHKFFVLCPVDNDTDKSVVENNSWDLIHGPTFYFEMLGYPTLLLPSRGFSEPWNTVACFHEAYKANIYLNIRPYMGSYVDKIANELEIAHFETALFAATVSGYKNGVLLAVNESLAEMRNKKTQFASTDSICSVLIRNSATKLNAKFGATETLQGETSFRCERLRLQILFGIANRLYPDDAGKRAELEKKYAEYIFPRHSK
ncbi:MAG: hypothetical protein WCG55_01040 [bacterium]